MAASRRRAIGPGAPLDTDRFFILCPNVLGGSGGSTGPRSLDPATGRPYGLRFPVVTVADMVAAQIGLMDALGIARIHAVVGGCLGGFQTLEWMIQAPDRIGRAVVISATPRTSAHSTALFSVLRAALMSDPAWNGGDYYEGPPPDAGLGLLGITGALFWMSRETLQRKFGCATIDDRPVRYTLEPDFAVEGFLDTVRLNATRGNLDANSLIYLTRAVDYFDVARDHGSVAAALAGQTAPVLLVSYGTDWRYPPDEVDAIRLALPARVQAHHAVLDSPVGHGAFLYDFANLAPILRDFLA